MTLWLGGADGVRLAADSYGDANGMPVILLGGLGQTRHSWRRAAQRIGAAGRRALTIDLRGHGESDRAPDSDYSYPRQVADLAAVVAALGRPAALVGASLGGKICLAAAGYRPETACALALVDTVPRTIFAGVRAASQVLKAPEAGFDSPQAAAVQLADLRGEAVAPGGGEKLRRNMRQSADGRWHWHWDARYSSHDQGLGMVGGLDYLEAAAVHVAAPTLILRGELSNVVDAAGVAALKALIPQAETDVIAGARHMLVGDENEAFADRLEGFLARLPD